MSFPWSQSVGDNIGGSWYLRYTKMKCPNEWKINLTSSFLLWRYTSKCNEKLFEVASRLPLQWVAWLRAIISKFNLKFWGHITILTHSISSLKKCLLISFFGHCFIIILNEDDFGVGISNYWLLYVSFLSIVWASWIPHKIKRFKTYRCETSLKTNVLKERESLKKCAEAGLISLRIHLGWAEKLAYLHF